MSSASHKLPTETYKHGHSAQTVNAHAGRTIYTAGAFVVPHVKPGMKILDVGCGPGSITQGFAELAGKEGRVIGMDMSEKVISVARESAAQKGLENLEFMVADGGRMPFEDGTFDVVFCHAVLVHAPDAIGLLAEMRRVCKTGGIVAAREAVNMSYVSYPEFKGCSQTLECIRKRVQRAGGDTEAGGVLHVWARQAGFSRDSITHELVLEVFRSLERRAYWGNQWAERTKEKEFIESVLEAKDATEEELKAMPEDWVKWKENEDAWATLMQGELICRK